MSEPQPLMALFSFCCIAWTSGAGVLILTWRELTPRRRFNGILLTLIAPLVLACMMFAWTLDLMKKAYYGDQDV